MKSVISLVCVFFLLCAFCSFAFADVGNEELYNECYRYVILSDSEVKITWYYGEVNDCHLDSNIGHRFITELGDGVFENHQLIEHVKISSYVRSLGDYVFHGCPVLYLVDLPNSVQSIGKYAFQGCSKLQKIVLPEGVRAVEEGTFMFCSELKEVSLPSTLERIGSDAFVFCTMLESLYIPSSVTEIATGAFRDCRALTLKVPSGSYAEQYAKDNAIPYTVV